jgi:hypothetical protein
MCFAVPRVFSALFRLLDVAPADAVMVGDSVEDDVKGAAACGCSASRSNILDIMSASFYTARCQTFLTSRAVRTARTARGEEAAMPFEEKITWVNAVVTVVVPIAYFAIMLGRLGDTSAADIAYQKPLLIAIGASIVLTIIGAILTGIGSGISAELRGRRAEDEIDRKDERDKTISRHGDLIGYYVASAGMVGVLALTMLEYEYFWIANTLYLSFVVATLVASVVKLVAYHRGF